MLERTLVHNPLIPHLPTPRQIRFLELECLDALYGGAAGGGKSDALLMAGLQFAAVPGYSALVLRRTFADLKLPGALIDRSDEWLRGKARYNAQEHRWRLPAGGTLQFGYCDHEGDEQRYRGSEFQFIGLDEATQFTETQLRFLFSRLRRRRSIPVPLRYRLGSNPGGPGHEFVKGRYIKPGTRGKAFVPASLADNPYLDQGQYLTSLAELDPLTRAQLLAGDWDAVAGGRFKADWLRGRCRADPHSPDWAVLVDADGVVVERFKPADRPRFQTCDPAASTSAAADYFVLSTWLLTPKARLVWWDCVRDKLEIDGQVRRCQADYRRHRPQFVAVEEVLNQRALAQLLRRSTDPVMVVRGVSPLGRDKLARAAGGINLAADGRLFLSERIEPLEAVVAELTRFVGDEKQDAHDDVVDTLSYAAEMLPQLTAGAGGRPGVYTPKGR
jgi:predicted phage terminase large subunit-like protein